MMEVEVNEDGLALKSYCLESNLKIMNKPDILMAESRWCRKIEKWMLNILSVQVEGKDAALQRCMYSSRSILARNVFSNGFELRTRRSVIMDRCVKNSHNDELDEALLNFVLFHASTAHFLLR